jgi:hypothetical protein
MRLAEHREGLADAGGRPEVDPQLAATALIGHARDSTVVRVRSQGMWIASAAKKT